MAPFVALGIQRAMTRSIAFVGAGPTTLYTLNALFEQGVTGADITVYEAQASAGLGSPYRPGWNDPAMLSNIASIEIPPVNETLLAWLQGHGPAELLAMGVDPAELSDRAFVPRVVLGRYFEVQFGVLVERIRAAGNRIEVCTGVRVVDAANTAEGMLLTLTPAAGGTATQARFDHVVLATGHQWPSQQEVRPGYFLSPWPATALAEVAAVEVGIRGTSLTAMDAALAIASAHGAFVRSDDGLVYEAAPDSEGLSITMMSRKGLLPEADFYFPLPHTPLTICTPEAIEALRPEDGDLLDAVFDLFRRELLAVDPAYGEAKGLAEATLESFSDAYFAERAAVDPFEWAAANLAEARANHAAEVTVPWRDGILRMHEVVATIVPRLNADQFERFSRHFKPIFVDTYGAVPHESVERMLALHRAGKLEVLALGDAYRLDTHRPEGGVLMSLNGRRRHFPVFIEATGQRPLGAIQFPFLSLLEQGIVRDQTTADAPEVSRGILIDDVFHPIADNVPADRLFCVCLPFIMGRHPFVQGITSSHEMGEIVGRQLALALRPDKDALAAAA
jgi:uncharacterized NAD(P)/FAD-binding protein YdhS